MRELKISIQVREGNVQFCGEEIERRGGGVEIIVSVGFVLSGIARHALYHIIGVLLSLIWPRTG